MTRDGFSAAGRRGFASLLLAAGFSSLFGVAGAHDHWISHGFSWCCGEEDCAPMSAGEVREVAGGYLIVPTGEVIPAAEALPSADGAYWRCRYLVGALKGRTRCFFRGLPGS